MKKGVLFVIFLVIGILAVAMYKKITLQQKSQAIQTPLSTNASFSLAVPPKNAITGSILSSRGEILVQKREATVPATLVGKTLVLQGEEYWTEENARLSIRFPAFLDISLQAATHVSFIQTLPRNFVILQYNGEVTYTKPQAETPVSVRIWPLLIQQNSGTLQTKIDTERGLIYLTVVAGSITVGFNNTDNISTLETITAGNRYTFATETREGIISRINE